MSLKRKTEALISLLKNIERDYTPCAFENTLSAEDMVLTDILCRHHISISIFTLDTGRLHDESYNLLQSINRLYGNIIEYYTPNNTLLQNYMREYGPNGIYDNVDLRSQCCSIRRAEPLDRALKNQQAWITGRRLNIQNPESRISSMEWDSLHQIPKFNPLQLWSTKEIWEYIRQFNVPYHTLYDENYSQVGCSPCYRARTFNQQKGLDVWWWENVECEKDANQLSIA